MENMHFLLKKSSMYPSHTYINQIRIKYRKTSRPLVDHFCYLQNEFLWISICRYVTNLILFSLFLHKLSLKSVSHGLCLALKSMTSDIEHLMLYNLHLAKVKFLSSTQLSIC